MVCSIKEKGCEPDAGSCSPYDGSTSQCKYSSAGFGVYRAGGLARSRSQESGDRMRDNTEEGEGEGEGEGEEEEEEEEEKAAEENEQRKNALRPDMS